MLSVVGLACIVFGPGVSVWADEPVLNNVDFLLGITRQELRGTLGQLGINQTARLTLDTLRLVSVKSTTNDWLLEYAIVDVLGKKQIQIARSTTQPMPPAAPVAAPDTTVRVAATLPDSAAAAVMAERLAMPAAPAVPGTAGKTFRLEYRIIDAYVQYHRIWREGFIGVKKIERSGRLEAYVQLVDAGSGTVAWQDRVLAEGSEVVLFSVKPFIENTNYAILKTDTVKPYWKDFVEVTLAGGSVGYLLYLFFSKSFN